jgi:ABC-type thiamine transport system ATPase subunit
MLDVDEWMALEAKAVSGLERRIEHAKQSVVEEQEELAAAELDHAHSLEAQKVISTVAQTVQAQAHKRISSVVTTCLAAIFDDPYEFRIAFEQKRGRTEAKLRFVRNGHEVEPVEASGGGVVDVAAFALRSACIVLHRPRLQKVVFMDEPFKFVSREFRPAVRSMLEQVSRDLGMQIILVTHDGELQAGKVIDL